MKSKFVRSMPDSSERMNKYLIYFLIFSILVLIGSVSYVYFLGPLEVRSLAVKFSVGDVAGIDINNTALAFGKIISGSKAVKNIFIENNRPFSVIVKPFISKSIMPFITTENETIISAGSQHTFPIQLNVPEGTAQNSYQGEIMFVVRKA